MLNVAEERGFSPEGTKVHLKGYSFIKVFRFVSKDGDTQYWATDVLNIQEETTLREYILWQ
jgi:hypothetical protein